MTQSRHQRRLRVWVLGWMMLAVGAAGEDALVLHLPFDGSLGTPAESHAVRFEAGKFGQAAHPGFDKGESGWLVYDVSGRMDARKGTLAFWVRTAVDLAPDKALGRLIDIRAEESIQWNIWLRISLKGQNDFTFDIVDSNGTMHGGNHAEALKTWKANEWHHLALVWHCLKGVRVYDNGREVLSTWGKERWEPLTPTTLGFGCVPGKPVQAALWFDEARLYTEPLDAAQIAALTRGEDVRVEKKPEVFPGIFGASPELKLRQDLAGQPGLPLLELGKPVTLRQHLVKAARVQKVTSGQLVDGRWRGTAPVTGAVDVEFVRPVCVTHVALDGPRVMTRIGTQTVSAGTVARIALTPPLTVPALRLEAVGDGPALTEIRFFERAAGWRSEPTDSRVAVEPATGPLVEFRGPVLDADQAVMAVSLDLRLQPPWPAFARLELTEETERSRALLSADVRVQGEGTLQVTLDWPDYVIRKGSQLIARVLFDAPTVVAAGSALLIQAGPPATAGEEYVARQLGWFKSWYSDAAEAHPWDSRSWTPANNPELRWLQNVRAVVPDHPLAMAYYNRIYHKISAVDVSIPAVAGMPAWACAQREALRRSTEVVYWWIDHRQTDDGQFGGNWNDDVEMMHGWDLVVLATGDAKVRQSMARLCDGIWAAGRFTHGYSNLIWDVEHAAEESTYSQPRMVPLEYGNPKWLERCMETTANFGFWTAVNPQGHRHFKGYMFQAQAFRPDPETDSDAPDNARAAKIGLYVIWYNGNEQVKRWFREWADAWCADCLKPIPGKPDGAIPGEIVFDTCQIGRTGSSWSNCKRYGLGAIAYHMEDQLVGTYLFTGDRKYLAPVEAQVTNGRAGEAALVNWRRLTGDTKLDKQFVERADRGQITPAVNAWLATRDKSYLTKACTETVRELARNRYLITEAEPPTDRVPMPGNVLLRQMILGGIGVWVCGWPQMAVSWEGTGSDFAALVLESTPTHLKVLAANFGPQREIGMRVWELARGTYALALGPDRNEDDNMDTATLTRQVQLDRAVRLPIELAAQQMTVVDLRQTSTQPAGPRPDLAIAGEDVKLAADRRTISLRVHNIGSQPSKEVVVRVQDAAGTTLGETRLAVLPAPDDLVPKTRDLSIPLAAPATGRWQVVIDPAATLDEITRENNVVDGVDR